MRRDGSADPCAVVDAVAASLTALVGLLDTGRTRRSTTAALSERGYNSGNAAGPRRNLSAHTLAATKPTICAMTLESAPFSAAVTA